MPAFDVSPHLHPQQFREATQRVSNIARMASPEVQERGRNWYPAVHDATVSGSRDIGIKPWHGAGIVAAVSPNMDWERNNINALGEISELRSEHWATIRASQEAPGGRMPEAREMLREVAPSVSSATDLGLLKAHRMLEGEDPETVLPRRTSPKTNSFAHDIHDPDSQHVTIDGRQADMIANNMRSWTDSGRGISSAALPSGKATRYEDHEEVVRAAARNLSRSKFGAVSPTATQAITWEQGKVIERSAPTKSGKPRKVGVKREGQPYV